MKKVRIILCLSIIFQLSFAQNFLARLVDKEGKVNLRPAGDRSFSTVPEKNSIINSGDALRTGENSFARIVFPDDESSVKIFNESEISVHENFSSRRLQLEKGEIAADIRPNLAKSYSLETPNVIASLEDVAVEVNVGKSENFKSLRGTVEVTNLVTGEKEIFSPEQPVLAANTATNDNAGQSLAAQPEYQPKPQTSSQPQEQTLAYAPSPEENYDVESTDDQGAETSGQRNWNMGLGVGSVTIDGKLYNQISLRPELRFGKLGVGLDLYFYLDEDGSIRKEDWDDFSDYLNKIYYVRWGRQGDPFFVRAGAINHVTLGYGILMSGYTNAIEYPQVRNIGLHTGMKYEKLGWEVLVADVKEISGPGLMAGRVTYDLMSKFRLGGTFVADFNQYKGLQDTDEDDIPDIFDKFPNKKFSLPDQFPDGAFGISGDEKLKGKDYSKDSDNDGIPDDIDFDIDGDGKTDNYYIDPDKNLESGSEVVVSPDPFNVKDQAKALSAVAFDAAVPLLERDAFKLDIYGQSAFFISEKLTDYYTGEKYNPGWGAAVPGFRANIFNFINCNLEYRFSGKNFLFSFWDRMYDMERVSIRQRPNNSHQLWAYTKDEMKLHNDPMKGVFGSVDFNIWDFLIFSTYYQHMTSGDDEMRSFRSSLSIPSGKIPKLAEATAYYQRNNDKNPFKFKSPSENTVMGGRLGLEIGGGAVLSYVYTRTYRDLNGNGKINTDEEAVTIMTIETGFRF